MHYESKSRPNFFVVGTFKGGTTSIHQYLSQHPDIYLPKLKEPRYFAYDPENPGHRAMDTSQYPIRSEKQYLALFDGVEGQLAIGEASPIYLDSPIAATRIAKFNPDAKIIVSLRDPVSRAVSGYQMWVRSGKEHRPIADALQPGERWLEGSLYAAKLRRYYEYFPRCQIKVVLFEDLVAHTSEVTCDLYEFLGVARNFAPDTQEQFNPGGMPKSRFAQMLLYRLKYFARENQSITRFAPKWTRRIYYAVRNKNLKRIKIPKSIDRRLAQYFAADAEQVAKLTGARTEIWRLHERASA